MAQSGICDVCGTTVDDHEGLLSLSTDDQHFASVCSWLCAAQFSIAEASKQRDRLLSNIQELKQQSERIAVKKQIYGFHHPST